MISIPKGTKDVLPSESYKWQYLENIAREIAKKFCINEIRTPIFEHTELFLRGVGETTDIVNKEMYTFIDKGNRSMTLKPEGTAGVARSFVENSLDNAPQPVKMFYITPVFRYERPQSGRLREHHQFGVEIFGSHAPETDIEVMMVAYNILKELGITNISLNINSIGCSECRGAYNESLKAYLAQHIDNMCPTCKERFNKNPLRILDCKEPKCIAINADAPVVIDHICGECRTHHDRVCSLLDDLGIKYNINPKIVRGLDYYTRTVFEFISEDIGAQGTICGGGRYNNLVEQVGGKPCPAVGFGMGLERLLMVLENLGLPTGEPNYPDVYVAPICDDARKINTALVMKMRSEGLRVETDLMNRSVKAQMKYANKINARYVVVIGEEEIVGGYGVVKNMANGESSQVKTIDIIAFIKEGK